ncbi:helix-turn-helix domain-containing protein, partial [bacterium]|nr:helix-turn-helix domain-containing protein [bacterium]
MESVGELLKHEREAQGKTLEDVARATKLTMLILKALEADHFSVLPAPVYVKGHLRTYARFLGMNEEVIVDKYLRFTQQQEHEELDEWDAVELELHEEKRRTGRRWVWIAVVVTVVAAAICWYAVSERRGTSGPETGSSISTSTDADTSAVVVEPVQETVADDAMIEWHKLELVVVARDRTWLRVSVDGEPVADLTLERGDQRQWEADEFF